MVPRVVRALPSQHLIETLFSQSLLHRQIFTLRLCSTKAMSSTWDQEPSCCPPHPFRLILMHKGGGYYVRAESFEGSPTLVPYAGSDLAFNLSATLGNDNGKFDWGRSFFERTIMGSPVLETTREGCILKANLLDIHGWPNEAAFNLYDRLMIVEYRVGGRTYHRLMERDPHKVCDSCNSRRLFSRNTQFSVPWCFASTGLQINLATRLVQLSYWLVDSYPYALSRTEYQCRQACRPLEKG